MYTSRLWQFSRSQSLGEAKGCVTPGKSLHLGNAGSVANVFSIGCKGRAQLVERNRLRRGSTKELNACDDAFF